MSADFGLYVQDNQAGDPQNICTNEWNSNRQPDWLPCLFIYFIILLCKQTSMSRAKPPASVASCRPIFPKYSNYRCFCELSRRDLKSCLLLVPLTDTAQNRAQTNGHISSLEQTVPDVTISTAAGVKLDKIWFPWQLVRADCEHIL